MAGSIMGFAPAEPVPGMFVNTSTAAEWMSPSAANSSQTPVLESAVKLSLITKSPIFNVSESVDT
jgi:hypothetical protein